MLSSLISYIVQTENIISASERFGPSRVSPSPITEDSDISSYRGVMALECCSLIKKWMQSKCNVISGNDTCLKEWTIFYIQFRNHKGVQHIKTVILERATHSYKGTITPVIVFIDVKLMFKRRLLWPVWKHYRNIITEFMRKSMRIWCYNNNNRQSHSFVCASHCGGDPRVKWEERHQGYPDDTLPRQKPPASPKQHIFFVSIHLSSPIKPIDTP